MIQIFCVICMLLILFLIFKNNQQKRKVVTVVSNLCADFIDLTSTFLQKMSIDLDMYKGEDICEEQVPPSRSKAS